MSPLNELEWQTVKRAVVQLILQPAPAGLSRVCQLKLTTWDHLWSAPLANCQLFYGLLQDSSVDDRESLLETIYSIYLPC